MSENTTITPLNWKAIVGEALRRRKVEKMTQREHAALANVSVPTMAAFERVDTALSLSKAFDILRVVGMVCEPSKENLQDIFVRESFDRWNTLCEVESKDSHKRFSHGWFRFDYYIEGDIKHVESKEFEQILTKSIRNQNSLPPFSFTYNSPLEVINDKTIECYFQNHGDFWRASPDGRLFFISGYKEDFEIPFPSNQIFDVIQHIWYISNALLHAERLAALLKRKPDSSILIHFQFLYTGLKNRVLRSTHPHIAGRYTANNEILLKTELSAQDISQRLAEHLYPLISLMCKQFGVEEFSKELIESVVRTSF